MNSLPYGRQWIDEDDIQEVINVLRGELITTGPKVKEFEDKIAEYAGVKYAVAYANGTAALHAACFAAGIGEGDEVITTPMTFAASANCAFYVGAKPVFADILHDTYNIDPNEIEKKITTNTKAVIPVDFTGQPCDYHKIMEIAKRHNLVVIEDAAHAIGASYKGRKVGSIADMTTFSLHPVKNITTGEGGIVTTDNKEYYKKLMLFRTHGITRDAEQLINNEGPWYYEQLFLGYNYRLTDFQAALGISQLKKLDGFIDKRRHIAQMYSQAFKNNPYLIVPFQNNSAQSAWHIYVIQVDFKKLKIDRKTLFKLLVDKGVGVNVHYIPVHYHPWYREKGYKKGICPIAESLYEGILTLPLFPQMTESQIRYVINEFQNIIFENAL